jgi:hypothetical protein
LASTSLATPVAEHARHLWHDRLGTPGPFVDVVSALGPDAPLEGVEPLLIAQPQQALSLGCGRYVTPHRGGVCTQPPRAAAEQLHYRFALELATQVPQRGIEPGDRAAAVAARKLVLALLDAAHQRLDAEGIRTERPGCDLPVEDGGGDVGIVGRGLTPSDRAAVRGEAYEAHELAGEGLEARDLHDRSNLAAALALSTYRYPAPSAASALTSARVRNTPPQPNATASLAMTVPAATPPR